MIYFFDDYELDTELYELRRGHQLIRLEPKVLNVLAYLLKHHDRIIAKSELLEHLWPDRNIGHSALERCIMNARKAIGDRGNQQKIIKTFNRHGYRVVVPVCKVASHLERTVQTQAVMPLAFNYGESTQEGAERQNHCAVTRPEPQRQCVTVLACTFVIAQSLVETDDIKNRQPVLKSLYDQIVLPVQAHGGLIVQFQDSFFLALFGLKFPEDHAWKAVQAALELQCFRFDGPQELETDSQVCPPCIGLHTGEVIEKRLGDESRVIYMAIDDTMQFAANLCSCAEPGHILVSEMTYQLIQKMVGSELIACLAAASAAPTPMVAYDISQRVSLV